MSRRSIALPWGVFGAGNIGDEAMLQGFSELVRDGWQEPIRIWAGSRNPAYVSQVVPEFRYFRSKGRPMSPVHRWALRRSDAYLIVGDTPIMDYLGPWPLTEIARITAVAEARRKRIGFLGIGTERLHNERSVRRMREQIAPPVEHWTVRTSEDRIRLASYGVDERRVTVAADLAWLVPPIDESFGMRWLGRLGCSRDRPLIGVNVTHDRWSLDQVPELPSVIASALDAIINKRNVDVMLFANEIREGEEFDSRGIEEVLGRATRTDRMFPIPNRYWHPQEAMSFVACCDVTLSMRYHFVLFSAMQGVPFVSISRLGKLADLCRDLRWPLELPLRDAHKENIESLLSDAMENRDHLSETLHETREIMVDRARQNIRSLEAVLRGALMT
ncbi:MAG: polysaccharide pyruvyl transferase family protein [bacterium]